MNDIDGTKMRLSSKHFNPDPPWKFVLLDTEYICEYNGPTFESYDEKFIHNFFFMLCLAGSGLVSDTSPV